MDNLVDQAFNLCHKNGKWALVYRSTTGYTAPVFFNDMDISKWDYRYGEHWYDNLNEILKWWQSSYDKKFYHEGKEYVCMENFLKKHEAAKTALSYIITNDGGVSVYVDGEALSFAANNPRLPEVKEALKANDGEKLKKLAEPAVAIKEHLAADKANAKLGSKGVELKDGIVYYNGEPMHDNLTERIIQLEADGLPCGPMIKFLEKLMQNPSMKSRAEAWDFLSNKSLPICEDGDFIAFRKVTANYRDFYTGKVDNSVGQTPHMDRGQVDDDRERTCSKGYHVGSLIYARDEFHPRAGLIVVVKVNPAHIVSVPKDHNAQKCRVTDYLVLEDYKGSAVPDNYYNYSESWDNVDEEDLLDDEDDFCEECGEDYEDCGCENDF